MATMVEQYHGMGRRKSSVARVYLRPGEGRVEVNGRTLEVHLPRHSLRQHAIEPLVAAEMQDRFDVKIKVNGGGLTGQAGAIRLGLARALVKMDEDLRSVMREHGLMTRDARGVERKKPGQPGARKRFQFSKR